MSEIYERWTRAHGIIIVTADAKNRAPRATPTQ